MNKFIKKIVVGVLALTIGLSSNAIAFAESIGSVASDPSVGKDEAQGVVTEYQEFTPAYESTTTGTDVYLTNDTENVVVSVPKKVILSGTYDQIDKKYKGEYTVKVEGDFGGHKLVKVVPDNTVDLIQQGKKNITANIAQDKTDFTVKDVTDNTNIGNGLIEVEHLTAGSWNGVFNFNVSLNEYRYYSTLDKAVNDANNLTTLNSDVKDKDVQNAVAAMYIENDNSNANIYLLKDSNNTPNLNLTKNANIDLNSNNIVFMNGCGLTSSANLDIKNGVLNSTDAENTISVTNENANFSASDLTINHKLTTAKTQNNYSFNSNALKNDLYNVNSTITGTPENGRAFSYFTSNVKSINNFYNTNSFIDITGAKCSAKGFEVKAEKNNFIDTTVNVSIKQSQDITGGIYYFGDTYIKGANVFVETVDGMRGYGIGNGDDNASLTIESSPEFPVRVFGKIWGIEMSKYGNNYINGGTYTATDHTAYILGNAEIRNAEFYIDNYDRYSSNTLSTPFGFYCGGHHHGQVFNQDVVNLYNCKINNGTKKAVYGITPTWNLANHGYVGPKEINLYDCEIYGGDFAVFKYNTIFDQDRHNCKTDINLYGSTKVFDKFNKPISQEKLNNSIATWKTNVPNIPQKTSFYVFCGDDIINGYGKYTVETQSFRCYVDPTCNVNNYTTT